MSDKTHSDSNMVARSVADNIAPRSTAMMDTSMTKTNEDESVSDDSLFNPPSLPTSPEKEKTEKDGKRRKNSEPPVQTGHKRVVPPRPATTSVEVGLATRRQQTRPTRGRSAAKAGPDWTPWLGGVPPAPVRITPPPDPSMIDNVNAVNAQFDNHHDCIGQIIGAVANSRAAIIGNQILVTDKLAEVSNLAQRTAQDSTQNVSSLRTAFELESGHVRTARTRDNQQLMDAINEKTADKMTLQQVSDLIDRKVSERLGQRDAQDQQVRSYLQKLDSERPAEGMTLIETFRVMYNDQQDLRRKIDLYETANAAQGPAAPAHAILSGLSPAVDAAVTAMQQDIVKLKQWQATLPASESIKMTDTRVRHIESQISGILAKQQDMASSAAAVHATAPVSNKICSPSYNSGAAQPPPPGFGSVDGTPVGDARTDTQGALPVVAPHATHQLATVRAHIAFMETNC